MMLDFRRSTMRPVARVVPLPLHAFARTVQTGLRSRGLEHADVVSAAYPKSGSTWLRFVVVDLASGGAGVDFTNIARLSPPLGAHRDAPRLIQGRGRFVKTHEGFSAFPRFPSRGVYLVRDGRDVAVSMYHFLRRWKVYEGPFEDYLDAFLGGRVVNYGSWQEHATGWCRAAQQRPDDIAVLRYEEMLSPDGPAALRAALARIGWEVPLDDVEAAVERNDFESMQKMEAKTGASVSRRVAGAKPAVPFVRQGKAGQWQEQFSDAQLRTFDRRAGEALELAGYER